MTPCCVLSVHPEQVRAGAERDVASGSEKCGALERSRGQRLVGGGTARRGRGGRACGVCGVGGGLDKLPFEGDGKN